MPVFAGWVERRAASSPRRETHAACRKGDGFRKSSTHPTLRGRSRTPGRQKGRSMNLPRRGFLHLAGGALAIPMRSIMAQAQEHAAAADPKGPTLAQKLAAYAHGLRYEDLDEATIERVKVHLIDAVGCGFGAWDEKPVRICRDVASSGAGPATIIGTD